MKETQEAGPDEHSLAEIPYGFYFLIWIALLCLTQFTVTAAQLHIGRLGIFIAAVVTPLKALLVLYYVMHLRYEKPLIQGMVLFVVSSLVFAISFTFFDYSFR